MSASPLYGSVDTTLWTPESTGSFPLTATIGAWIDAEYSGNIAFGTIDGSTTGVQTILDRGPAATRLGPPSANAMPKWSDSTASLLINNRNTVHFYTTSPDITLSASQGGYNDHLPVNNEPRYIFMVMKRLNSTSQSNFFYQYGYSNHNRAYGLAKWITGSSQDDFNQPQYFFGHRFGSFQSIEYKEGAELLYTPTGSAFLINQVHSGNVAYLTNDFSQSHYTASSEVLTTGLPGVRDMLLTLGQEVNDGAPGTAAGQSEWQLGEFIILSASGLTENDRFRIEGYLAHKWGLTSSMGASHLYRNSAPLNQPVTGNVNFEFVGATVGQPGSGVSTSLTIDVLRSGSQGAATGDEYACAATIDQVGGNAVQNTDYTGLPVTLNWEVDETDSQNFEINGINSWGSSGSTLIVGFTSFTNLGTGTLIPNVTATFSNVVTPIEQEESPEMSPNGTINTYANALSGRITKNGVLPFAYSQRTTLTLRSQTEAITGSSGGSKNG